MADLLDQVHAQQAGSVSGDLLDQVHAQGTTAPAAADHSIGGFLSNLMNSTGDFAGNVAHAVTHPVDTLAATGKVITGGMQHGLEAVGFPKPIEEKVTGKSTTPEFDAFKQHLADRYGSFDNTAETMYKDPAGFLSDLSTFLDGAGVVADTAKLGKVAAIAKTGAEFTNPASLAVKVAAPMVNPLVDATKTALAKGALRGGYKVNTDTKGLGAEVSNAAGAMVDNGIQFSEKGLADLKSTLGDLQKEKDQATLAGTQQHGQTVDPNLVIRKLQDLRKQWETQAYPKDDLRQIDAVIADFKDRHTGPIGLDEAEALKEGTYRNNRYGNTVPPPHMAATAGAEQNIAHTLMEELERQLPELKTLNPAQARMLQLEPMLMTALTKYRNSGGFLGNAVQNMRGSRSLVGDTLASGLGLALSHDPAVAGVAGGSAAVVQALLSDPQIQSRLAIAMNWAQKNTNGAKLATGANVLRTIDVNAPGFGRVQENQ